MGHAAHHFKRKTVGKIEEETRDYVPTDEAALYMKLDPDTLKSWRQRDVGPIKSVKIDNRVFWPMEEIRKYMGK